ncbi:protein phosphatase CheZ [Methylomonas koyamae]|uniref:Protein phosphatase CheZ n=1 Tax=Methylomonas koyamae TaxID=702114 RepID=A0A291IFA0_9GAMM|nr:protein phosphatase CheZ [Methylomonas koyamae]ATG88830.1 chemotaxis protein CheZ [Methylomonas koyamae]OAI28039.1 chemotaxis protein CheZ [Methylomonas koyamae]WNB76489.1 protein phosphatase CheZ [Methylomonas koyamae]BBL56896.1 protein phosphatase CheZ [Methylomonas koyamae]
MNNDLLSLARELVTALEKGDEAVADEILDQVAGVRETQLFKEVGRLTRQLHDTMVSFSVDSKITAMAEHEIPDAKERLHYVIAMTEQAANQTLTAVEDLLPVSDELSAQVNQLAGQWNRFLDREMPFDEFKAMSADLSQYFNQSRQAMDKIQAGLNDILMAQGFQDITGQIIRRVIDLVQDLETSMVNLIKISSRKVGPSTQTADAHHELPGPVVPGVDDREGDVATSQVDVDDLLSSLGF